MRLAVWSGPRNLSTAMMYAFAGRADFAAWDEPFYAPFLAATGRDDPMRDAILAAEETDPGKVAERCAGPIPGGRPHFYMKHMPLHMVDGFPMGWARDCVHVHLLRHPARVIASYGVKREGATAHDIGFESQAGLYDRIGGVVIDSADIRNDPEGMLRALCAAVGLDFDPAMLSWPAGPRPYDGAWAPHWYDAIHRSTGFAGPEGRLPVLDGAQAALLEGALPHYERLAAKRIRS
ncbi:sulfotransferase family protein [Wenxinia saemankumensis]|uniref:Branched-chain amino acid aminotransferase n=1 Tax=Wenxinia saemankumensis TaxID=1447782 RepID=A0A1M6G103_9RHOB|nr:sulfotransferase family protein [Wenxinia saemankumensis]SHJ03610.1 hypothetical protein SAMN05444417_2616 [Wenxinia saemankumensis]